MRNANFAVQGVRYTDYQSVMTTLSSETSPDSDTLDAKLLYGSYVVSLQNADWYLERITPNGAERVAQAVLLSPAQQSVFLDQGQLARVAFQFGVDGDLVDFFGGQLEIGITVRQAPAADAGALSLP